MPSNHLPGCKETLQLVKDNAVSQPPMKHRQGIIIWVTALSPQPHALSLTVDEVCNKPQLLTCFIKASASSTFPSSPRFSISSSSFLILSSNIPSWSAFSVEIGTSAAVSTSWARRSRPRLTLRSKSCTCQTVPRSVPQHTSTYIWL